MQYSLRTGSCRTNDDSSRSESIWICGQLIWLDKSTINAGKGQNNYNFPQWWLLDWHLHSGPIQSRSSRIHRQWCWYRCIWRAIDHSFRSMLDCDPHYRWLCSLGRSRYFPNNLCRISASLTTVDRLCCDINYSRSWSLRTIRILAFWCWYRTTSCTRSVPIGRLIGSNKDFRCKNWWHCESRHLQSETWSLLRCLWKARATKCYKVWQNFLDWSKRLLPTRLCRYDYKLVSIITFLWSWGHSIWNSKFWSDMDNSAHCLQHRV